MPPTSQPTWVLRHLILTWTRRTTMFEEVELCLKHLFKVIFHFILLLIFPDYIKLVYPDVFFPSNGFLSGFWGQWDIKSLQWLVGLSVGNAPKTWREDAWEASWLDCPQLSPLDMKEQQLSPNLIRKKLFSAAVFAIWFFHHYHVWGGGIKSTSKRKHSPSARLVWYNAAVMQQQ